MFAKVKKFRQNLEPDQGLLNIQTLKQWIDLEFIVYANLQSVVSMDTGAQG